MIQFTGNKKLKQDVQERPKGSEKPWAFGMIVKSGIMLIMIFSACGLRVYFSDKTDKLTREAGKIRAETKRTELEIQNLNVKRERMYSLKYVQSKIAQYKLNLRPTANSQIRYLKFYREVPSIQDSTIQVAEDRPAAVQPATFCTASVR